MNTAIQFFGSTVKRDLGTPFISTWDTRNTKSGSTPSNAIQLPLINNGDYNFIVDYGDGTKKRVTSYNDPNASHTYSVGGIYTVTIWGAIQGWGFGGYSAESNKIIDITQWGALRFLSNTTGHFSNCANLNITATDTPNLEGVNGLVRFFQNCTNLVYSPTIANWDVSGVSDFSEMFRNTKSFSQNLDSWSMISATDITGIFRDSNFNGSVNGWDTSNITIMSGVFRGTATFNQPLNNWDLSNATTISGMFYQAAAFNQDINNWNIPKITSLAGVFRQTGAFNQPLNNWDVSNVITFGGANNGMFYGASAFNQPLNNWDMTKATNLQDMFRSAAAFDQDIGMWNVINVTNANNMFNATSISTANYDALLNGWGSKILTNNVPFSAGTSKYSPAGATARQHIIDTYNWTITDGGPA